MAFFQWSKTAASNATADSDVNWREGQAPSTVNNSTRAMMAALAKYRDDISGTITTGGASTAYTVTTNQVLSALTDGFAVAFIPHATNGTPVTLNVDSTGAKPLRGLTGVALDAGVLVQGTPYVAVYDSGNQEYLLHGYRGPDPALIPVGSMVPYGGSTAPSSSFVLCYGQAISRTTYSVLFGLFSTTYGVGDGSTTFNVPDLRGRAIFGLDNMGGSAAGRITNAVSGIDGTTRGSAGGAQAVTLARANLPNTSVSVTVNITDPGHVHAFEAQQLAGSNDGANGSTLGALTTNTQPAVTGITASGSFNLNGNVSQTDVNKMPPAIILPYILRVL